VVGWEWLGMLGDGSELLVVLLYYVSGCVGLDMLAVGAD